jgi:hypothetical protein
VHQEGVRLAGDEARLRSSVSAMFVSLSRRSQSLLDRLLRMIDGLELSEEYPERLANLFRMDHLATRMRRNSENLLVLAGHEAPRRWAEPVPLMDVLRAAVSEIEQYERVELNIQAGVAVIGTGVADTVHLLAELLENATTFSARTTQVVVSGHAVGSGGALIDITDRGMGIPGQQLAELNHRLDQPSVADVAISRHMGLFAVAHLAARHKIKVQLQLPPDGGTTAQVWVPSSLLSQDKEAGPGEQRSGADPRTATVPGRGAPGTHRPASSPGTRRAPRPRPRRAGLRQNRRAVSLRRAGSPPGVAQPAWPRRYRRRAWPWARPPYPPPRGPART